MTKQLGMLFLTLVAANTQAAVKCPEAFIQLLYPSNDKVFIQLEGQPWHLLTFQGDEDYDKKMARAIKASNKNLKVELTFPNGYDETCRSSNTDVVAKKIKLIKQTH